MPYWDKQGQEPKLPGLYQVFQRTVTSVTTGGARAVVGMVSYGTDSAEGKVHQISTIKEALALLGLENYQYAKRVFEAGASKVIVYVKSDTEDLGEALASLDTYLFDVFTLGFPANKAEADAVKSWRIDAENEDRYFVALIGTASGVKTVSGLKTVFAEAKHGDVLHLGIGVKDADGNVFAAGEVAAWLAGAQSTRGVSRGSLSGTPIPFGVEPEVRFRRAEREELYDAGIAVTFGNGYATVLESAITSTTLTSPDQPNPAKGKLRIAYNINLFKSSLNEIVQQGFIGKISNDDDGQAALIAAIRNFMDDLVRDGVITADSAVIIHPDYVSAGDKVYLLAQGEFLDAAEKFFFDFQVGAPVTITNTNGGTN